MADVNLDDLIKQDKEKNQANRNKGVWFLLFRAKETSTKREDWIGGKIEIKIMTDRGIETTDQEIRETIETTKIRSSRKDSTIRVTIVRTIDKMIAEITIIIKTRIKETKTTTNPKRSESKEVSKISKSSWGLWKSWD